MRAVRLPLFRIRKSFQFLECVSRVLQLVLPVLVLNWGNLLCYGVCSARSGTKCNLKSLYSRYKDREFGSLSLTVFVISVIADCRIAHMNTYLISSSNWPLNCGSISLEFVIFDKLISRVILIYWTNFLYHSFALMWSFFSRIRMGNFCVDVRSNDPVVVLFGID